MQANPPDLSSVYYGPLDLARGEDARHRMGFRPEANLSDVFYFGGLGPPGEHGVFFCKRGTPSLAVLASGEAGTVAVRRVPLNKFSPEALRDVVGILEGASPVPHELNPEEERFVLNTLAQIVSGESV